VTDRDGITRPAAGNEDTTLYTGAPAPLSQPMERQGIHSPQGLVKFADPEWEPDERSER
jgi:hypothetical protein